MCVDVTELEENLQRIYITDTTLRDGQQDWRSFTVEEVQRIYELLAEIGVRGNIRSTEVFPYTNRDRKVTKKLKEHGYEYPKVIRWIRSFVGVGHGCKGEVEAEARIEEHRGRSSGNSGYKADTPQLMVPISIIRESSLRPPPPEARPRSQAHLTHLELF